LSLRYSQPAGSRPPPLRRTIPLPIPSTQRPWNSWRLSPARPDDASALIEQGEPLESQVLSVLHPTLAATQAASDLDDLYGRMLLSNRHFVWAQTLFQKNLARWKYWQPQTDDTARRFKLAESQIAECERGIMKGPAK